MIIAYGTERVPSRLTTAGSAGRIEDSSRPGAPAVALQLNSGQPLRMSEITHPFAQPPAAQDLSHADTQLACLENHLVRLCGLWNKPLVGFIRDYFDALRAAVEADAETFARRTGALAGLVEPMHWCFAAPMPFPRAHLGVASDGRIAGVGASRTIMVDMLFQDSAGLVALDIGRGTRTPRRQKDLDALKAAGVRLILPAPARPGAALLDSLGRDFCAFADDIDLPRSPFRGQGVPMPVS